MIWCFFDEVTISIVQLNENLQKSYFKTGDKTYLSNEFHSLRCKVFKENKNRISEIGKMTRKMFNS